LLIIYRLLILNFEVSYDLIKFIKKVLQKLKIIYSNKNEKIFLIKITYTKLMLYKHAVIIGKFLPLHKGHMYLIESAFKRAERTTVLVCTLDR
jgi:hypothetical protein